MSENPSTSGVRSVATVAARRIQAEIRDWGGTGAPEGCCLESCEPLTTWVILMQGPEALRGMYDDKVFRCVRADALLLCWLQ